MFESYLSAEENKETRRCKIKSNNKENVERGKK